MFSLIQHGGIDYAANNPKGTNLAAGGMINEILGELAFQLTATAGNNVVANIKRGDELALIRNIRLTGEESLPILDVPGSMLRWMNLFDYGVPMKLAAALGNGVADPVVKTVIPIPMWSCCSGKPFDSSLDNTAEPNGLTLQIDWGSHTDVIGAATGFTVAPTFKVFTNESRANAHPFLRKRRYGTQHTFQGTGRQRLNLEGGNAFRRFFINTRNAAGADVAEMFSSASLYVGSQLKQTLSEAILEQAQTLRRGTRFGETITRNTVELDGANYMWEQALDGYLTHTADTTRRQGNYIEFDITTAPCTVTVVYEVLDDLRLPQFQKRSARGKAA